MSLTLSSSGEELREQFFALQNPQDVANLLEIEYTNLTYHLYISDRTTRYTKFLIPKKSGGTREISAPVTALKIIQRKLNQVLQQVYQPKLSVNGFLYGRSIVTNAKIHVRQRYVLNLDLRDFFPSINFGRVRGMFAAIPYERHLSVATVLAQICCFDNGLPQGAPTSPIVSNMICAKLDSQLQRLAKKYRCYYTRYADDITFSTSMPKFPMALATTKSDGYVEIGGQLEEVIEENGFTINFEKVRLQTRNYRQEVTGLTTNKFPNVRRRYVRQIRAMLHAWEKFGLDAAEIEFKNRYDKKYRSVWKKDVSFKNVVKGKIEFLGMVRGRDDDIYIRFLEKFRELDPEYVDEIPDSDDESIEAIILTEGKTDWKHLKAALSKLQDQGHFLDLKLDFHEYEDEVEMGDSKLRSMCVHYAETTHRTKRIFIFDRDNQTILKQISSPEESYKNWGNNVFSFAIPIPNHRQDTPEICIELYYTDADIKRGDPNDRRLFLSNEFHSKSGRHKEDDQLNCTILNKIRNSRLSIIDHNVYNQNEENVALSKSDFADYVLNQHDSFKNCDVSEFKKIFDVIHKIVKI